MNWSNRYDVNGEVYEATAENDTHFAEVRWDERWMQKGDHAPWEWSVSRNDMTAAKFGRASSIEGAQKACEEAMKCSG